MVKKMKTMRNLLLDVVIVITFILSLSTLIPYLSKGNNFKVVDEKAMIVIKKELSATLTDYDLQNGHKFKRKLVKAFIKDGLLKGHPFGGLLWTADIFAKEYTILIDSYGGYVEKADEIEKEFKEAINRGVTFKCYIANAHSAAFYLAVRLCGKSILLRGGSMSQHFAYYPSKGVTNATYLISYEMARKEAEALLIDPKKWFNITRLKNKNKKFTIKELKKYNIIQKVYGE